LLAFAVNRFTDHDRDQDFSNIKKESRLMRQELITILLINIALTLSIGWFMFACLQSQVSNLSKTIHETEFYLRRLIEIRDEEILKIKNKDSD
jgi:hypothetical protein